MAILADQTKPSYDQLMAIVAEQAKLLEQRRNGKLSFRVNDGTNSDGSAQKGGLSIFGLASRPTVLYASQWLRILDHADELRAFIELNRPRLAWKDK